MRAANFITKSCPLLDSTQSCKSLSEPCYRYMASLRTTIKLKFIRCFHFIADCHSPWSCRSRISRDDQLSQLSAQDNSSTCSGTSDPSSFCPDTVKMSRRYPDSFIPPFLSSIRHMQPCTQSFSHVIPLSPLLHSSQSSL